MITIDNGCLSAQFTPMGAAMMALHHQAVPHSLVLGFEDEAQYARNPAYLGAVCGRVSNRIGGATFDLNGRSYPLAANEGPNQLHGGTPGWSHRVWDMIEQSDDQVCFGLRDRDGEQGFPGNVDVQVRYRLIDAALDVEIRATTDHAGPIAPTTHNYFRFGDEPGLQDHKLWLNCYGLTALDTASIPTGDVIRCAAFFPNLQQDIDVNYCINDQRFDTLYHHATLSYRDQVIMQVQSNEPGLQVYNACGMTASQGPGLAPYAGLALEPQLWPDAVNHPNFPNCILQPGQVYRHLTRFDFSLTS